MLLSRGRNPNAAEVISQMITNSGLRNRVLTTLGLLMLVRLGIFIPAPGVDRVALGDFFNANQGNLLGQPRSKQQETVLSSLSLRRRSSSLRRSCASAAFVRTGTAMSS